MHDTPDNLAKQARKRVLVPGKTPNRKAVIKSEMAQQQLEEMREIAGFMRKIENDPPPTKPTPEARRVETLTILRPRKIPILYAQFGTLLNASIMAIRLSAYERHLLDKAAAACDVSLSTFVRWSAVMAAREIVNKELGEPTAIGWKYELESDL